MGLTLMLVGALLVGLSIYLSRGIGHSFIQVCKQHGEHHQVGHEYTKYQHKLGYGALIAFSGVILIAIGAYFSFIWKL